MSRGVTTLPSSGMTARAVVSRITQFIQTTLSSNTGVGASDVGVADAGTYLTGTNVETVLAELGLTKAGVAAVTSSTNAGAISVARSGCVLITTAGAETRSLAVPTFINQQLTLYGQVLIGNCVVTSSQAINLAGNTTITFTAPHQSIQLVAAYNGTALRWRVRENDGTTLG